MYNIVITNRQHLIKTSDQFQDGCMPCILFVDIKITYFVTLAKQKTLQTVTGSGYWCKTILNKKLLERTGILLRLNVADGDGSDTYAECY